MFSVDIFLHLDDFYLVENNARIHGGIYPLDYLQKKKRKKKHCHDHLEYVQDQVLNSAKSS